MLNINKIKIKINSYYYYFFYLFCFYIILNAVINEINILSLKSSFLYIRYFFFIIGLYFLYTKDSNILSNFFKVYLAILTILFIDSNYQILNDGINLFGINSYYFQYNRVSSFFGEELVLGSYVFRFAVLSIAFFYSINKSQNNILYLIIIFITLEIALVAGERTAFYSMILYSFLFIFFFINYSKKIKLICFSLVILLITIILFFNKNINNRIILDTRQSIEHTNFNYFSKGHQEHLVISYKLFKEKPLLGHGSNSFRMKCKEIEEKYNLKGCSTHPHNLIAQFLAEKGIIGAIFLFTFYIFICARIIKLIPNFSNEKREVLILFSILILFNPFVPSSNFYNSWVNNIIYLIFLILIVYQKLKLKND